MTKPQILTVDRNQRNLELLGQFLSKEGYQTFPVSDLQGLQAVLDNDHIFGLALVDISGFDRSVWECCEKLAEKSIPLLIISPQQTRTIQQESLSHGAQGVLFKPLVVKELASLIHRMFQE